MAGEHSRRPQAWPSPAGHCGPDWRGAMLAIAVLIASPLAGCTEQANTDVSAQLMKVEIGMTRSQVLAIVGEPQRKETYGSTEFLIYAIGSSSFDILPVAVVEGRVTGIGRNLYDQVVRAKVESAAF